MSTWNLPPGVTTNDEHVNPSDKEPYVEQDCTFTHEGKAFTSGGAVVTPDVLIAYPAKNGVLKDWHGNVLGTWKAVARWPIRSFLASELFQIEACVAGMVYTGRSMGEGMIYRGRRKAGQ